jgi:hypothetical protein
MKRSLIAACAFSLAFAACAGWAADGRGGDQDHSKGNQGGGGKQGGGGGGGNHGGGGGGNRGGGGGGQRNQGSGGGRQGGGNQGGGHQNQGGNGGGRQKGNQGGGGQHQNQNGNGGGRQNGNQGGNNKGNGNGGGGNDRAFHTNVKYEPRAGQVVIPAHRNWTPVRHHPYHFKDYSTIDIWAVVTFGYGGQVFTWNPGAWHYWIEPSLMRIVFRCERISYDLRTSFEQQMTQTGLRTTRGGQTAWNRVGQMDDAFEKLRSQAGYVPDGTMEEYANDAIDQAQLVEKSFNRHPDFRNLVPNQWDDLTFEVNELARYYGVNGL